MAKTVTPINPFDLSNYAGGGSIITPGRYRIETFCATDYDFGGKGDEALCYMLEAQPLNAKGKPDGDAVVRYLTLGQGVVGVNPIKGKKGCFSGIGLADDSDYDKLWKGSDGYIFMASLAEQQFDMDQDGDITVLEGLDCDLGVKELERAGSKDDDKVKDDKGGKGKERKKTHPVIIVTGINGTGDAKPKATAKDDDEDEKPAKKGGSKKPVDDDDDKGDGGDAQDLLDTFCKKKLCIKANAKEGVEMLTAKVDLRNWMREQKTDTATAKEVQALFQDEKVLSRALKAFGWAIDSDDNIKPEED